MTIGSLFRPEALQHLDEPDLGSLLRFSGPRLPATSWLLLIAALATSVVAVRSSFPVYESGIGVLRSGVENLQESVANCSIEILNPLSGRTTSFDAGSGSGAMYIAVLAGKNRPKLVPGTHVLLRLSGHPDVVVAARLDSVGARLLAADDVRSILLSLGADVSGIDGPAVSICGSLETNRFASGGVQYRLQDGLLASARVKVREERLLDRFISRAP